VPLLWLLAFVPVVFIVSHFLPEAPTLEEAEKVCTIFFPKKCSMYSVKKLLTILTRKEEANMKRYIRFNATVLAVLLAAGVTSTALAAETSGCVTCHLDKEMLVKNLSVIKAKKSTMQSGSG